MGPVQTWIEHLFLRHAVKPCGATQSCCACRTGARLPALCTPAALGRPGQRILALPVRRANSFGCALPASLGHRPKPFFALAVLLCSKDQGVPSVARPFTGQRVHWTLCNAPVHPWLGRSPGPASTGRSPDSGSPPGALANLRLTHGEPVRPGKVSLALFLHRPHPCRLGARIPGWRRSRKQRRDPCLSSAAHS